jgi:hypothetical protein
MKKILWVTFLFSRLFAQVALDYPHSLSLQIGEPWSIRYQRPFLKHPDFQIGAGIGMLGLIRQPDYASKFSLENGYRYYGRTDIFTLDVFIRRYLQFNQANNWGLFIDLGIHNRFIPEIGFKSKNNTQMYIPNFFFWEPIPYCQLGGFVRLGSRRQFELNIQYGLGVNVLFVPGYLEQIGNVGLGYRFERAKRKKE